MREVVVYDFDKTLTYRDTLWGYFTYCGRDGAFLTLKKALYMGAMLLSKLKLISNSRMKACGVALFLRGKERDVLERLSEAYGKEIAFNRLYRQLSFDRGKDYFVVTASFEEYVRPLFPSHVDVVGSRLFYREGYVAGVAENCYKELKAAALKQRGIDRIDLLYTDSISDLALAQMAEKICVVKGDSVKLCQSVEDFRECVEA